MPLSGTRVLLVEDDGMIVMLYRSMLAALKCDVVGWAVRVPDALKKANTLLFDVAVLDINLAGTLSYPVAEALKKRGVPFIFATSYGRPALPPEMQTVPLLSKPFDLAKLTDAILATLPQ